MSGPSCECCAEALPPGTHRCPHCGEFQGEGAELRFRTGDAPHDLGLAERLPEWPDQHLLDALARYRDDYTVEQQAALLAEVDARGLAIPAHDPSRRTRADQVVGTCTILLTILLALFVLLAFAA